MLFLNKECIFNVTIRYLYPMIGMSDSFTASVRSTNHHIMAILHRLVLNLPFVRLPLERYTRLVVVPKALLIIFCFYFQFDDAIDNLLFVSPSLACLAFISADSLVVRSSAKIATGATSLHKACYSVASISLALRPNRSAQPGRGLPTFSTRFNISRTLSLSTILPFIDPFH